VLQDTGTLTVENHPVHLHGFNFFIVGRGFGNYDSKKDPAKFNLVDPPERNTVGVPTGGWTAIRFRGDNPGVWNKYLFFLGIDKPDIHKLYNAEITFNSLLYPKQFSDLYQI
jgi:hypothetical protein